MTSKEWRALLAEKQMQSIPERERVIPELLADLAEEERASEDWMEALAESERLRAIAEERAEKAERRLAEQGRCGMAQLEVGTKLIEERDALAAKLKECQKELGEWMKSHAEICEQKERQEKFTEINRQAWISASLDAGRLREALIWCSGSDDFAPGGKARAGWEKLCAPLLATPDDGLWEALKPYIQHQHPCPRAAADAENDNGSRVHCTCGLDVLLGEGGK